MKTISMRALRVAAGIMLLVAPAVAVAQVPKLNLLADKPGKSQEEKDAEAARDKAYNDSLKKIPDGKPPADPWGGVRSDAPAAPAKSPTKSASAAKAKAKNPNSANSGATPN